MISIKDINKAIVKKANIKLKNTEYEDVKFVSTDITEEIIRPSFYLDLGIKNKIGQVFQMKERNLELFLYYFCKDTGSKKTDLMTMQGYLEDILLGELIVNESFYFYIEDVDFETRNKDGYLIAKFELYSLEEIEVIDNYQPMENLKLNIE